MNKTINIAGESLDLERALVLYDGLRKSTDEPNPLLDISPFQASDTSLEGLRYAHGVARRMLAEALYKAGEYPLKKYQMGIMFDVDLSEDERDNIFNILNEYD